MSYFGNDTFVFNQGYGQLEITEQDPTATPLNVLKLGVGIAATRVEVTGDSSGDVILTDGIPGDRMQLDGQLGSPNCGVQQIQFADGTVWTSQQVDTLATMGTTGDDAITGTFANEIFDGKGGNDMITGDGGSNTYMYRPGYGVLTINNASPGETSAQGQLDLAAGLDETNLWFAQTGNDLAIDVLGTSNQVIVQGWFGGDPSAALAEIEGGDGLKIDGQLNQLIAAMATFQGSNAGFNPMTAAQMPSDAALQSSLAAAWHH